MQNVGVVFGGKACEHDISIITALQLINNFDKSLYRIHPIYVSKDGAWNTGEKLTTIESVLNYKANSRLCAMMPNDNRLYVMSAFGRFKPTVHLDVVFVAMHGMNGEDGMVCNVCNISGVVCVNSDILPSSVALDKCMFKKYLNAVFVPTVHSVCYTADQSVESLVSQIEDKNLSFPLILKPSKLGSSIGISVCNTVDELREKLLYSTRFDSSILLEEKIANYKEYNIAAYASRAGIVLSDIEEPVGHGEILSYSDKYLSGSKSSGMASAKRIFPAKLSAKLRGNIEKIAQFVYQDLMLSGVVRFDFLYDIDTKKLYLNELNAVPGSYAHYLFTDRKFSDIIDDMISYAIFQNQKKQDLIQYFSSSVLKNANMGIKK